MDTTSKPAFMSSTAVCLSPPPAGQISTSMIFPGTLILKVQVYQVFSAKSSSALPTCIFPSEKLMTVCSVLPLFFKEITMGRLAGGGALNVAVKLHRDASCGLSHRDAAIGPVRLRIAFVGSVDAHRHAGSRAPHPRCMPSHSPAGCSQPRRWAGWSFPPVAL